MNKNWLYFIVGFIVLLGLFYALKPKPTGPTSVVPAQTAKTFTLIVQNKKLVSGPDTLKVTEGDKVTINITNDAPEELHLHGYDKHIDLEASKSGQLTFTANLTGRFPYELENSKTEIGALEVQPK